MSSTNNTDQTIVLDTGSSGSKWVVAFQPDEKHLLGGSSDGIRRWRLADGEEVGKQTGMDLRAIAVSRDGKWIVCGTTKGASIWDAELRKKVIGVQDGNTVSAVDISPDSTRFATGTGRTSIWSITTGQRLVGPLASKYGSVYGIRFSPNGEHIATAYSSGSIHVVNSRNGHQLITIDTDVPHSGGATPLAWSSDGQRIFATALSSIIRSFDVSTGSQLAESPVLRDGNDSHHVHVLALAANDKFIAACTPNSISFLDTSTLSRIGPVIEDRKDIWSISISSDSSYLATGRRDEKIVIRHLSNILPDSYGPFHVSTREEVQQDTQPSTSGGQDDRPPDSTSVGFYPSVTETAVLSASLRTYDRKILGNLIHLGERPTAKVVILIPSTYEFVLSPLEVEVPSTMPGPEFDYDEVDVPPTMSPPEARLEENPKPPQGHSIFKKWLKRKSIKGPTLHKPDRLSSRECEPVDRRSHTHSPARVDEGPSWMAAGQRKARMVATSFQRPKVRFASSLYAGTHQMLQRKPPAKAVVPKDRNVDTSRSGHGPGDPKEASAVCLFW
ncbi:WD40-repeat-containing domain protein [Lanmaoa asiatica]|nr:WD40-repeat-containing domain protein [Lanmaoa asiatica]